MEDQQYDNTEKDQDNNIEQQLTEALAEAEKNLDGWKRSQADFQNYQRRKEEENKDLIQFAREVAVAKLLPTLDSLAQAIKHAPTEESQESRSKSQEFFEKYNTWKNGLSGIVVQLDKALAELGVKKIEALGKKFDPNYHEAVREVDGETPGIVVEEYQVGYELNGKVIRPSQVAISK